MIWILRWLAMRWLLAFLFAALPSISSAKDDDASYQRYLTSILPQSIADTRLVEGVYEVKNGRIIAGIAHSTVCEFQDSEAVLFVVLKKFDGTVKELGRAPLFDFRPCSKSNVEAIEVQSNTRFWVQFNHRSVCGGGTEVYQFAFRANSWVVSGRDVTYYQCGNDNEGVGDNLTKWSGNFLTERTVATTFRHGKLVDKKVAKVAFPKFPLSSFKPFDSVYGPR